MAHKRKQDGQRAVEELAQKLCSRGEFVHDLTHINEISQYIRVTVSERDEIVAALNELGRLRDSGSRATKRRAGESRR